MSLIAALILLCCYATTLHHSCTLRDHSVCASHELYSAHFFQNSIFLSSTHPFDLLSSPSPTAPLLIHPSIHPSIYPHFSSSFSSFSSEVRWSRRTMILSASAPASASRPSEVSGQGGRCPHARLEPWWGCPETRCRGTCPDMRGGRGRARTLSLTRRRGQWFV